jgi:hypothetical protein
MLLICASNAEIGKRDLRTPWQTALERENHFAEARDIARDCGCKSCAVMYETKRRAAYERLGNLVELSKGVSHRFARSG